MEWNARLSFLIPGSDLRKAMSSASDWEELLGPLPASASRRLSLQQAIVFRKTKFLEYLLKNGGHGDPEYPVQWRHLERLVEPLERGEPVIAAACHMGPVFGLALGLRQIGRPLTLIVHRQVRGNYPATWEPIYTEEGKTAGVVAFRQSLTRLKQGGLVAMACDVFSHPEDTIPVKVFGVELYLKRGFAALARASGATIIPLAIRWERTSGLIFEAQPPLESTRGDRSDREAFETAVVREYGARLDASMHERPFDLEPRRVQAFVQAARRIRAKGSETGDRTLSTGRK